MRKQLLLITFLLFSMICISQNNDSIRPKTLVIKMSLAHFATGEAYFSVEKFFIRHRVELGCGIIYPFRLWYNQMKKFDTGDFITGDNLGSYYQNKGFAIRTQYKYMLHKKAPLYISPLFMFKCVGKRGNGTVYYNDLPYEVAFKTRRYVYAIEFLVGAENFRANNIFFDFYVGIGARYCKDKTTNTPSIYSNMFYEDYRSSTFRPSLHIGMNIGLGVK
jgi:hypothetical protein